MDSYECLDCSKSFRAKPKRCTCGSVNIQTTFLKLIPGKEAFKKTLEQIKIKVENEKELAKQRA